PLFTETRRKRLQVFRLRLPDDLHAPRLDVFVIAGKCEPRLLHARPEDRAIEAVVAGDQLQRELVELARKERADVGLDEVFGHPSMVRQRVYRRPSGRRGPAKARPYTSGAIRPKFLSRRL